MTKHNALCPLLVPAAGAGEAEDAGGLAAAGGAEGPPAPLAGHGRAGAGGGAEAHPGAAGGCPRAGDVASCKAFSFALGAGSGTLGCCLPAWGTLVSHGDGAGLLLGLASARGDAGAHSGVLPGSFGLLPTLGPPSARFWGDPPHHSPRRECRCWSRAPGRCSSSSGRWMPVTVATTPWSSR